MPLTRTQIQQLVRLHGQEILCHEHMQIERVCYQHGVVTTFAHSIRVACLTVWIADRLHLWHRVDLHSLIRAALLHDYFLYDWHKPEQSPNWHGFKHARIALQNACKDFNLNILEEEIIKKHMWPLNVSPPRCREAWIVNFADTYCSLLETIHVHKNRF